MSLIISKKYDFRIQCECIVFKDRIYTNDLIHKEVDLLTDFLKNKCTHAGSPFVYLFAYTHIKTIIAFLAILKAGLTCVLIEPEIGKLELREKKRELPPCALIRIRPQRLHFHWPEEIEFPKKHKLDPAIDFWAIEPASTIIFASEKNGYCLPVQHTLHSILANTKAVLQCKAPIKSNVIFPVVSFAHIFALQTALCGLTVEGGNLIIPDLNGRLNIKQLARQIEKYKVTDMSSNPIIYYFLAREIENRESLKSLIALASGSYKLAPRISRLYAEKFNLEIREGYGLSEASMCSWNYLDDKIKPGSVGRPFPFCEISIRDAQNHPLPAGTEGEVCIKGDNVMNGYWQHPEATAAALQDEWLHTGDKGLLDSDNFLYLTGLSKAMLNVSGKKVYPREVERLIREQENVEAVSVYGEYSELLGDAVAARISLKKNNPEKQEELKKWFREQLTGFKIPKKIIFS